MSQNIQLTDNKQAGKFYNQLLSRLDDLQMKHKSLSFGYALIKKYSQDQGGNQAALITYYGFLSLFPLLVAALSFAQLAIFKNAHLKSSISSALNNYFPLVGHQLQSNVHGLGKAGIALGISILVTIYGAKGVSSILRQAMDGIWQVPRANRAGGVKGIIRSLAVIFIGGAGFIVSGILSSYGAGRSSMVGLRILSLTISFLLTYAVLLVVLKLSVSVKTPIRNFYVGTAVATVGLQIIQAAGGFVITHELGHFSSLYGSLAIVFVVLFWIYLQARVLLYAAEIDTILYFNLWPRSITGFRRTVADQKALKMYVKRAELTNDENIEVRFESQK